MRFLSYDSIKLAVADKEVCKCGMTNATIDISLTLSPHPQTGRLTLPRSILAGFIAGLSEGLFAVTPSEAIKTRLIEDGRKPLAQRRYKGLISGSTQIIKEEGIAAIYRGLGPTMVRQGANSAVRLTTYSTLRAIATKDGRKTGSIETFGMGAVAGIVTVYCTMPFDVVKTRMQSASSAAQYTGALNCAATIFKQEGLRRFWKGTTPRLTRLILSGGIVFTIYENTLALLDKTEAVAKDKVQEVQNS